MLKIITMQDLNELIDKKFNTPYIQRQFEVKDNLILSKLIATYWSDFAFKVSYGKYILSIYKNSKEQSIFIRDNKKHKINKFDNPPVTSNYDWCIKINNDKIQKFVNTIS